MAETPNDLYKDIPKNNRIIETFFKMASHLDKDKNIAVSISGGSDSDCILDLVVKNGLTDKIKFVYFDTGLEYQATKDHIKYLEDRYGVCVCVCKPTKSIPYCAKNFGQPFLSKKISDMIERLQSHNFKFEDKPFEELYKEYPNCKSALRWWCNEWGEGSMLNISRNRGLKEFIVANPPTFKISAKCCDFAKKNVSHRFNKEFKTEISVIGVRKAEGGARSTAYKSCFSDSKQYEPAYYRPIFWWSDADKKEYCDFYDIKHSDCYTKYNLRRTGCCGCPYGQHLEDELKIMEKYEPKLFKVVNVVFGESYAYTRAYRKFQKELKQQKKGCKVLEQYL